MKAEKDLKLERVCANSRYISKNVWRVTVHVVGTTGDLARYGFALSVSKGDFWDFQESDLETVLNW